jgi:hypothetical protein
MCYQTTLLTKCLITHITDIWMITTVYALMSYQNSFSTKCLITHMTHVWTLTAVYMLMSYQISLLTECLITHITDIWTVTTVNVLMSYQITFVTEPLITHITGILVLITMYAKLLIQCFLLKNKNKILWYILIFKAKSKLNFMYENYYSLQDCITWQAIQDTACCSNIRPHTLLWHYSRAVCVTDSNFPYTERARLKSHIFLTHPCMNTHHRRMNFLFLRCFWIQVLQAQTKTGDNKLWYQTGHIKQVHSQVPQNLAITWLTCHWDFLIPRTWKLQHPNLNM